MAPTQWILASVAHSDLFLVLHVSQLHILCLRGGWGLLQVASNHELVHEDTGNGTEERRDDRHPPPMPAGPERADTGNQRQVGRQGRAKTS